MKCPREFYYKYISKLPEKKTIHLFRGTLVHKVLEDLFKNKFRTLSQWEKGGPAIWVQDQFEKFWKHVAGHRANEIAYIYGERDKPDYLGKVYRKILEPICWSVGMLCKKSDWSILYKSKEI